MDQWQAAVTLRAKGFEIRAKRFFGGFCKDNRKFCKTSVAGDLLQSYERISIAKEKTSMSRPVLLSSFATFGHLRRSFPVGPRAFASTSAKDRRAEVQDPGRRPVNYLSYRTATTLHIPQKLRTDDMPAQVISGKEIAAGIRAKLREEVTKMQEEVPGYRPGLAVVQVGNDEASNVYIRMKMRAAEEAGMNGRHIKMPQDTTQNELVTQINQLNADPGIHGMIVQLPLDTTQPIDSHLVLNTIDPAKDVDGLHDVNSAKLARGNLSDCFVPCTPRGCLELIKSTGTDVDGKNAVVVGRSKIVGAPMSELLTWNHATVTVCHSHTSQ
ncbi:C-1-tetrahydrofolate synthase, cytoplasmic-like, partial [Branchiostoma lanceolatum]|uniref:C-1-tetrahydrofolate synthase, cytoplasmic-like n=1 Tax=Branchiostoma lanceolatum TaxID=7740 RepID=UPI00345475DC